MINRIFLKCCLIVFFLSFFNQSTWAHAEDYKFEFYDHQKISRCNGEKCLKLDDVIVQAKKNSFASRKKVEDLYQARKNIKVKVGSLLPGINTSLGIDLTFGIINGEFINIIPSFLGFLVPDNWFRWKESKLFYMSEKYSFITLLANQVNTVENIFYTINSLRKSSGQTLNAFPHLFAIANQLRKR